MEVKNKRKYVKGITLIALVLTIIVFLILAGVSLNLVAGSNGILSRTTSAVNATKQAQLEEELQLSLAEIMMDYYIEGNGKTLQEYIIEQCNKSENNGMLEVGKGTFSSIDGDLYYTDSNGNISMITVDNNGNVSIEGSVAADGTVNDTNPPLIFVTATTNSISLVLKDPLSGIAGWAYSATNEEATTWNEVSGKPKSYSETITELKNGTTYYIWAKDVKGNISQVKEVKTKDFDELSYDVTWEGVMATIIVRMPTSGVQYLNTAGNWVDYTTPVSVESGTTVQFKVTDGNNEKTYEAVKPLKKSTITYDANGGTGNVPSVQTAEHTNNVAVDFSIKPSKSGMRFIGWSQTKPTDTNPDETELMESGTTTFAMPNHDVTLYAVYQNATPVYGTSISSDYGTSIYTNANTREKLSERQNAPSPVAGNYFFTSGLSESSRAQSINPAEGMHEQSLVQKGDNTINFTTSIMNNWTNIQLIATNTGYNTYLESFNLRFKDENSFTIAEAVNKKYIEPLVLYSSPKYVWTNVANIITGEATDSRTYPQAFLFFKVKEKSPLKGVAFYTNNAWDGEWQGFRCYVFEDLEISTEPF